MNNYHKKLKQKIRFERKQDLKNTWDRVNVNRNFEFRNIRALLEERGEIIRENDLNNPIKKKRIAEIESEWQQDMFRLYEKGGDGVKYKARVEGRIDSEKDEPWEYWSKPYVDRDGWCSDDSFEKEFVSRDYLNRDPETPVSLTWECPYFSKIQDVDAGIDFLTGVANCPEFIGLAEINVMPQYAGLLLHSVRLLTWLPPVLAEARKLNIPAVHHLSCVGLQIGYQLECHCLAKYPFLRTRSVNNLSRWGSNMTQANFDVLTCYNVHLRGIASAASLLSWENPAEYWGRTKIQNPAVLNLLDLLR